MPEAASGRAHRAGLTRQRLVEAAAAWIDDHGVPTLNLTALAKTVGVKTPSLYNHVDGLDDLRRELRNLGLRTLQAELQRAAVGRAGADALDAAARAYRAFAAARPGLYALTQDATITDDAVTDEAIERASAAVVGVVVDVLAGYDLRDDEAIHAARVVRSALHGFISLEMGGGFSLPVDVDASFARLVAMLDRGLSAASS